MRRSTTISWLNLVMIVIMAVCVAGEIWGHPATQFWCAVVLLIESLAGSIAYASRKSPAAGTKSQDVE